MKNDRFSYANISAYISRLSSSRKVRQALHVAQPLLLVVAIVPFLAASTQQKQVDAKQSESAKKEAAPTGNAENGRKIYVRMGCQDCHGFEGQGAARTGPRIGPHPVSYEDFMRTNRNPSGQMPPYTTKIISDKELADIYAFLCSLPGPLDPNTVPALKH